MRRNNTERTVQDMVGIGPGVGVMLFNALAVWPLWRIFRRVGRTPHLAWLVFVPVIGLLVVVAVLALVRWPLIPRLAKAPKKARRVVA